jgi:hypothetical protein
VSPPATAKVWVVSEQLEPVPLVVTLQLIEVATAFLYTTTVDVSALVVK